MPWCCSMTSVITAGSLYSLARATPSLTWLLMMRALIEGLRSIWGLMESD